MGLCQLNLKGDVEAVWAKKISPVYVEMDWCRPCVWNSKSSASTWEAWGACWGGVCDNVGEVGHGHCGGEKNFPPLFEILLADVRIKLT